MKIDTTIVRKDRIEVDIAPDQAIGALQEEITRNINKELESLSLPPEELKIPRGGFDYFYVNKVGEVRGYHMEDRPPRETETDVEIKWGVERFKRILYYQSLLAELRTSDVFPEA